MNLIECIMTNSSCYKRTTTGVPVGILWHDTAAGNPDLKRYVQPSKDDPDREKLLKLLGVNQYGNDWNNTPVEAGLNAWIGKLADGSIATVQALPWNYRPWGCGKGSKGSCNGDANVKNSPFWLQFEICDDAWSNAKNDYANGTKEYFDKVYKEAVEFTAFLCKMFNIDPNGSVQYNGVTVPTILCHADAYKLGLGSNHKDVLQWFSKYGKTMADVRKDVTAQLNQNSTIYRVQVGAFRVKANAEAYLKTVQKYFPDAYITTAKK